MAGCHSNDSPHPVKRKYNVVGKVVSLDKVQNRLTVETQAIPDYMQAMTMTFPVKDSKELNDLTPGDEIRAELILDGSEMWLQKIVAAKKPDGAPTPKN